MNKQQTIERIIRDEIYVNASTFVQDLLSADLDYIDELMDCLGGPDYSEAPDGYGVHKTDDSFYWDYPGGMTSEFDDIESSDSVYSTEEDAIRAAWDDSGDEPEMIEALQHWLVSDWLADKLEAVGGLVARDVMGFNVWGRTECGQSLTMDSDLGRVAEALADE